MYSYMSNKYSIHALSDFQMFFYMVNFSFIYNFWIDMN